MTGALHVKAYIMRTAGNQCLTPLLKSFGKGGSRKVKMGRMGPHRHHFLSWQVARCVLDI